MRDLLSTLARRDESEGALGRHSALLASLIVLLVALPFTQARFGVGARFPILLGLVLVAAVLVNSHQRWVFIAAMAAASGAIGGGLMAEYLGLPPLRMASEVLSLSLLGFTTLIMLNSLLRADDVSQDTIVGGICVYLLLGLCFAMTFILMVELDPGAFMQKGEAIVRNPTDSSAHATTLLYFSFVTMTTLGYGDVSPESELAQMSAVAEALIGQLYLTIFVARLVALYVGHDRRLQR